MLKKLEQYAEIIDSPLSKISKTLDPRFSTDSLRDSDLLRKHLSVPLSQDHVSDKDKAKTIFDELYDEDSLHGIFDDEITRYVRATANGDRDVDPLPWWKTNEQSLPNIASLAKYVLASQSKTV